MTENIEPKKLIELLIPKIKKKSPKEKMYTEERRQKDRERILKHKPWEKTKGAITPEGKKKVSMNAYKHGRYSKAMLEIEKLERELKKKLKQDA